MDQGDILCEIGYQMIEVTLKFESSFYTYKSFQPTAKIENEIKLPWVVIGSCESVDIILRICLELPSCDLTGIQ